MGALIAGLILFLGIHSLSIVNEPWRDRMVARIGEIPWQGIHSLIALAGLALIAWGYGLARQEPVVLYVPPTGLRHGALLLMAFALPLFLAAYLPGRIQTLTRHPMLLATQIWALAHLMANGMLHDVLLFGAFLIWAVVDRISLGRRRPRPIPGAPPGKLNDVIAVLGGLGLYLAFLFHLHAWLFGVPPL